MTGKEPGEGWCRILLDTGEMLYLPRGEYSRLDALLEARRGGWFTCDDVFGATRKFRLRDICTVADYPPEAVTLEALAGDDIAEEG